MVEIFTGLREALELSCYYKSILEGLNHYRCFPLPSLRQIHAKQYTVSTAAIRFLVYRSLELSMRFRDEDFHVRS